MISNEPYNDAVRAHFANPAHAGDLAGEYDETLTADASESEKGARIVLSAGINDGMISEIRFRAWGCPHLIAAAELMCTEKEGGPVATLADFSANRIMTRLSVPPEKTGKILLLEDALKSLSARYVAAV